MKKLKITVRWFDGFEQVYIPIHFEFCSSWLWMKFENREIWLPLVQIRDVEATEIKEEINDCRES